MSFIKKQKKNFYVWRIFLLLIICNVFPSCNHFNGYEIAGNINNGEQIKVYLEDISQEAPVIIDTAVIRNKSFELKNYSYKGIYRLRFGEDPKNVIFLYIKEKDKIRIASDMKNLKQYTVEGSSASSDIQRIMGQARKQYTELDTAFFRVKEAPDAMKDSLKFVFSKSQKDLVELVKDFVKKEENADVACFALNLLGPSMKEEIPYLVNVTNVLHEADPKSKYINTWYKSMQQYRDALLGETQGGVALNTDAPNIILQDPKGDTIQLKNLLGNYVLLDFWASWCQPCRQENPNVVALYNQYHAQGFEVFSVSLDANQAQWAKAIAKDGLIWKNHGCDFGGWQSAPAQLYKVDAIPCTFLLDKKGKVIAKNLHGEALEEKLKSLLAQKKPA
ncbi:MAG: alkyl hydroperoxide reductase [Bacteroidota bacterium]|nr:alkyl hydroperoxide reductase [Bacteroidota bacterium]